MTVRCNVPFSDFLELATNDMKGRACPIKEAIGASAREIPRTPGGTAKIAPNEWRIWLSELPFDTSEIHWPADETGTISGLKSKGSGDEDLAAAIYYRMHYHTSDLSFAHKVDQVVFGKPFHERYSHLVFEDAGLTPNLRIPQSANSLHFSQTKMSVLGRSKEKAKLEQFLEEDGKFRWLQVAGVAGQGKSRLAYDLIEKHNNDWHAGFLNGKDLIEFSKYWQTWKPKKPTLIVIDYVLGQEPYVKKAIQSLAKTGERLSNKVRLILVERQRWDRGGLEKPTSLSTMSKESISTVQPSLSAFAEWFLKLCDDPDGFDVFLAGSRSKISDCVIELRALSLKELVSITKAFSVILGCKISRDDKWLKKTLARIDKSGRPLFAYILAVALVSEGKKPDDLKNKKLELTREGLLSFVLNRERNRRWIAEFGNDAPRPEDDVPAMRMAILATIVDGFDNGQMRTRLPQSWDPPDRTVLEAANVIVDGPRGRASRYAAVVPALQPDLLGEWFVLSAKAANFIDYSTLLQTAWRIEPKKTAAFLERCAQDFPFFDDMISLLEIAPPDEIAENAYGSVSPSILFKLYKIRPKIHLVELPKQLDAAAMQRGHVAAIRFLAFCKYQGLFFERNVPESLRLFKTAAEAGDSIAMYSLGICFNKGEGVTTDPVQATEWFRRAAEAGHIDGMCLLGIRYSEGTGITADPVRSTEWFHRAAEAGQVDAMYLLGGCYDKGKGVTADPVLSAEWFRRAAKAGQVDAMCILGSCYDKGKGVAADPVQSTKWFRKAAEAGHSEAMFNLGFRYDHGLGVTAHPIQSIKWYLRAADIGHHGAMFNLGVCFSRDDGVTVDPVQSIKWYRRAAEAGHSEAMFNLGVCFDQGKNVTADLVQSTGWFRKAAEAGVSEAMYRLGFCYNEGNGVPADPVQSTEWFRRAAEAGHSRAMFNLGVCFKQGKNSTTDSVQSTEWFRKAAEAGLSEAMFVIGDCYDQGIGVIADPVQATYWFHKAAEAGDEAAQRLILSIPDRPYNCEDHQIYDAWNSLSIQTPWPISPLFFGDWQQVTNAESKDLICILRGFSHLRVREGIIANFRRLDLKFYPGFTLVECLINYNGHCKIVCLLNSSKNNFILNGDKYTIKRINRIANLSLPNSSIAKDYLGFYSASVLLDDGSLRIVDKLDASFFYNEVSPSYFKEFDKGIELLNSSFGIPGKLLFLATGKCGSMLFRAKFSIDCTAHKGEIEMVEVCNVVHDLPLFEEGFDGVFRYFRKPNNICLQN